MIKIVVKNKKEELLSGGNGIKNVDEQVFVYDPLTTLNQFMKLYQCLWASFTTNLESQYEISVNEFRVLMMVGQTGETAAHEIADNTGMPVMAISRTVSALEKRGLIERKVDAGNRRRKPFKLTAAGRQLFNTMMPASWLMAKYLFDSLRLDEMLSFDHCLSVLTKRVTLKDEQGELVFVKETKV